jgi:beta-glucosidase
MDHVEPHGTYRDTSLPIAQRVNDLLRRMTLAEKVSQMQHRSAAIERLGVPAYDWWSECLHGVARAGRATVFPQAIGLAATFDVDLVRRVAEAISTEARAKHHLAARTGGSEQYGGLTFWSPNINIFRDGRWGRGQETYGEDPVLTAEIGKAFVRGLQGDDPKYLKVAACAKHFAVHSGPEGDRHHFDARVSRKDLFETYLPAFEELVKAGVESVMGAYNRVNGEPCCASTTLLKDILRGRWGFQGHVVSDCGAIKDIHANHKVARTAAEASAAAVRAGCDLNCGSCYATLPAAVQEGLIRQEEIDRSAARLLTTRFKLGLFDEDRLVPYASIPPDVVGCRRHVQLARQAAVESIVLLKNANDLLPLGSDVRNIFVTGHNAANVDILLGNYYGLSDRLVTVLEGVVARAGDRRVDYRVSTQLDRPNADPSVGPGGGKRCDAVVAVLGISPLLENEEGHAIASASAGDREDIALPRHQVEFLRKISQQGKPVVLVLAGGSAVALEEVHDLVDAILFAWYPGQEGGSAVADILFGDQCPSGRLPVTFPRSLGQLPPFEDYSMAGRTYRYMTEQPMYPFGFGLSYTRFEYGPLRLSARRVRAGESLAASVTVKNVGAVKAEEVVQLYLTDEEASAAAPRWALKAFRRVRIAPGRSRRIRFEITPRMMELIGDDGDPRVEPGAFTVTIGGCSPGGRGQELGAPVPATGRFQVL